MKTNNKYHQKESAACLIRGFLENKSVMKRLGYNFNDLSEEDITTITDDLLQEIKTIGNKYPQSHVSA